MNKELLQELNTLYANELVDLVVKLIYAEDSEDFETADALNKHINILIDNTSITFSNIGGLPIDVVKENFTNGYFEILNKIRKAKDTLKL